MKKVIKKAVAKVPVKKTVAKKPMMKTDGSKKSLPKAQKAGQTPFQEYLTIPGTSAKDTVPSYNTVEKTKTYPTLKKAYELTYGQDFDADYKGGWNPETLGKYRGDNTGYSNMNSPQRQAFSKEVATKKAAAKKQKVGGATKSTYKKGGVVKKVTAKKVMVKSKKK